MARADGDVEKDVISGSGFPGLHMDGDNFRKLDRGILQCDGAQRGLGQRCLQTCHDLGQMGDLQTSPFPFVKRGDVDHPRSAVGGFDIIEVRALGMPEEAAAAGQVAGRIWVAPLRNALNPLICSTFGFHALSELRIGFVAVVILINSKVMDFRFLSACL